MVPQRPNGSTAPVTARRSGSIPFSQTLSFEAIKTRVLAKLEDRLDPATSKRMPATLLRQSLRTHAEQVTEQEARNLPKPDRDRLVDEVLAELLGYGPLGELFKDPTVREIMVTGPHTVIVRRDQGQWLPTSVKFRDEEHVRWSLDKLADHADPVGGMIASLNLFDLKLPNGFRALGVIPPPALSQPATVAFIRTETIPVPEAPPEPTPQASSSRNPAPATTSASAATTRSAPGTITASPRPGSSPIATPLPRNGPLDSTTIGGTPDPLTRHRNRIVERLISKMASLGVYDLQQIEITELRKVVAAFIREYVAAEKLYLTETDQGRLMLEILTTMHR